MNTIVLVNPPYSFWSPEKNYLRPFIGTLPSLGLLTLAGVLRRGGNPVKIVESASLGLPLSKTLEYILRERPKYPVLPPRRDQPLLLHTLSGDGNLPASKRNTGLSGRLKENECLDLPPQTQSPLLRHAGEGLWQVYP